MPRARPSIHADFVGWNVNDFMAAMVIELRKMNMRSAGVADDIIDDATASPEQMLDVMELLAEIQQKFQRSPTERVGIAGAIAQMQTEKAKPRAIEGK